MSLPTKVTNRAEGNSYIGNTGMTFVAQTGFAIRTGFYITNSGNYGVSMGVEDVSYPRNEGFFEFLSGVNEPVSIPAGSTSFIEFDFYAAKQNYNTGAIIGTIDLGFTSDADGFKDDTYYSGPQPVGVIRNYLTGLAAGYVVATGPTAQPASVEFVPSHPSGFLVLTGQYDDKGQTVNSLHWQHPSAGYYFEKYKIQVAEENTNSWSDLQTIEFERKEKTFIDAGNTINGFYYGTPTGLNETKTYAHKTSDFNKDFYYRIRGEHYDQFDTSSPALVSQTDWVYGYPVADIQQDITNIDILTGLVSGSSTLPVGGDPSSIIKSPVGSRSALGIYFENNESNINLYNKFEQELDSRGLDRSYFTPSNNNYNFTGVHFILPEGYVVGSNNITNAGIETGDRIEDAGQSEIKTHLYLNSNSIVAGRGGNGGDSGEIIIEDFKLHKDITSNEGMEVPQIRFKIEHEGTKGTNGTAAIKITNNNSSLFKIIAHQDAKIYGGGGGGGGGDSTFWFDAIKNMQYYYVGMQGANHSMYLIDDNFDGIIYSANLEYRFDQAYEPNEAIYYSANSVKGKTFGGAGGGGQGFFSLGGKLLGLTDKPNPSARGNIAGYGLGNSLSFNKRMGEGGNGGAFGEDGERAPTIELEHSYIRSLNLQGRNNDTKGFEGGKAGYAIDASDNPNYTVSNFRSNLFFIKKGKNIDKIKGFVAYWDAQDLTAGNLGTWNSNLYNLDITQPTITPGSTPPVVKNSSMDKFNGNKYVLWTGSSMSAQFNNIIDNSNSLLLGNDIVGFDIFYNMLPANPATSNSNQFNRNGHKKESYIFHTWSDIGDQKQFRSFFYDSRGFIVENLGIDEEVVSFTDTNYQNNALQEPSTSFVYNVSASLINKGVISYKTYYNKLLLHDSIFRNKNISFIDNPVLGAYNSSTQKMAFAISDIIIFNRRLNINERESVSSFLSEKNRVVKTIVNSSITASTIGQKNNLLDLNGFAGYVSLNS
jgi:hypothetical protein